MSPSLLVVLPCLFVGVVLSVRSSSSSSWTTTLRRRFPVSVTTTASKCCFLHDVDVSRRSPSICRRTTSPSPQPPTSMFHLIQSSSSSRGLHRGAEEDSKFPIEGDRPSATTTTGAAAATKVEKIWDGSVDVKYKSPRGGTSPAKTATTKTTTRGAEELRYDAERYRNRSMLLERVLKQKMNEADALRNKLLVLQDVVARVQNNRENDIESLRARLARDNEDHVKRREEAVLKATEETRTNVTNEMNESVRAAKEMISSLESAILEARGNASEYEGLYRRERSRHDGVREELRRVSIQLDEERSEAAARTRQYEKDTDEILRDRDRKERKWRDSMDALKSDHEYNATTYRNRVDQLQGEVSAWENKYKASREVGAEENERFEVERDRHQRQIQKLKDRVELYKGKVRQVMEEMDELATSSERERQHWEELERRRREEQKQQQRVEEAAAAMSYNQSQYDEAMQIAAAAVQASERRENSLKRTNERLQLECDSLRAQRHDLNRSLQASLREKDDIMAEFSDAKLRSKAEGTGGNVTEAGPATTGAEEKRGMLEPDEEEEGKGEVEEEGREKAEAAAENMRGEISHLKEQIRSLRTTHAAEKRILQKRANKAIDSVKLGYERQLRQNEMSLLQQQQEQQDRAREIERSRAAAAAAAAAAASTASSPQRKQRRRERRRQREEQYYEQGDEEDDEYEYETKESLRTVVGKASSFIRKRRPREWLKKIRKKTIEVVRTRRAGRGDL